MVILVKASLKKRNFLQLQRQPGHCVLRTLEARDDGDKFTRGF